MTAFQVMHIAGILNIVFLILVLISCRCIGSWGLGKLFNSNKFQKFYKYHCWYWYGFIISVLVHTITAFYIFGWPF